jgi:hypothetical protein
MEQVNKDLIEFRIDLFRFVKHCGGDRPYIHPNQLDLLHQEVRRQSIEKFRCARKMGGEEMSQNYQQDLDTEIAELYRNDNKIFLSFFSF